MSQVTFNSASERPGIRSAEIFENLDDLAAAYLLPGGAFKLIATLGPDRINGPQRAETLGSLLSLELAVDDPARRKILLNAMPASKIGELEERIGLSIDQLRQRDELEQPVRRALLGFFGVVNHRRPVGCGCRAVRAFVVPGERSIPSSESGPRLRHRAVPIP